MKKILFGLLILIGINSFGQTGFQTRRVNERLQGKFMVDTAFYLPRFTDTVQANLHKLVDTCGSMFFSYTKDSVYFRACNPKRWITVGSGSGGLSALDTLEARTNIWDVVQNSGGTTYKSTRQIVYNVKDYGATGDGVTDDQPFIQRAIDSCHSQGGGVVYFTNGIYLLTATASTGMHLKVPISAVARTDTATSIEFRGETPPMMWTNPLTDTNNAKPPLTGAILQSSLLSNTSIIATDFDGSGQPNFCNVVIKNLGFRVRSKTGTTQVAPQGIAIDGTKLMMLTVDMVRIDTESPRDSTVMPTSTAVGIYFPRVNNWCQILFTNSLITGYYKAIVVGEHFKANNVELDGNYRGLNTWSESQYHSIEIAQMGFWRNAYNIYLEGTGRISITHAVFEDDTTSTNWFDHVADLHETPGGYSGAIGFAKNISFAGPYDAIERDNPTNSYITTYPFVNPLETTGLGHGLVKNLGVDHYAITDYQSTGNSSVLRVGQAGSGYGGFGAIAASDGFILEGNNDLALIVTNGTKVKIGIGASGNQTQEINSVGFKHASSTYGALLGTIASGVYPGIWLGSSADAPTSANMSMLRSNGDEATIINGVGTTPSVLMEINGDFNNVVKFSHDKYLGIGHAYNGTVAERLDVIGNARLSGFIKMAEQASPSTPASGYSVVYPKTDGLWYGKDDAGVETKLSNAASASGIDDVLAVGQALTANRTIATGANTLTVSTSTGAVNPLSISSTTGNAIQTSTSSGIAVVANTSTGVPISAANNGTTTNDDQVIMNLYRATTGTAASGIAGSVRFNIENDGGSNNEVGRVGYRLSNAASAAPSSQYYITAVTKSADDTLITAGSYVDLTESTATRFTQTTIGIGKIQGGMIIVTVQGSDATDYQSRTLRFIWSAVNKANTLTITISTPEEVVALSAGTLTCTITAVDAGSGVLDFKANAVSSLTQTTLRCSYQTFKNF